MKNRNSQNEIRELCALTAREVSSLAKEHSVFDEPTEHDGVKVVPVSKLSVGFAGGGADIGKKSATPMGTGAKVTKEPLCVLVMNGKDVRLLSVPGQEKPSLLQTAVEIIKKIKK